MTTRPRPFVGVRPAHLLVGGLVALGSISALLYRGRSPVDAALTATVHRGTLSAQLTTTGTLRPIESLTYRSPVPGRDVEILELVPEGTRVKAGDPLVRLDSTDVARELTRARDDLRQAQLDLDVAEGEWDEAQAQVTAVSDGDGALAVAEARATLQLAERRAARTRDEYQQLQPLLARGFITREELGRSASEFEQADAELALARQRAAVVETLSHPREQRRATLTLAQKDSQRLRARARVQEAGQRMTELGAIIDGCTLYARGAGLVVYEELLSATPRRKVRVGDRVTSSQGIVTIPEVDRMLVDASVSEADIHRVAAGQRAEVHVEAFPGVTLTGTVTRVGTVASVSPFRPQQDKRFSLVVTLDATTADLRPDMSARADIQIADRPGALLVPPNAVFDANGTFVAHRLGASGVETRPLTLGESNDEWIEVLSGLDEGNRVLLASPAASAGSRVASPDVKGAGPLGPH
jgi:multidrug efflux pump subunit AcrA (membrane-fusion protein)